MSSECIFVIDREDYNYRGVLFSELDNETCSSMPDCPHQFPEHYCVGVLALIWTDENGLWHAKVRLKFPSGNKQVYELDFAKEMLEGIQIDEEYILSRICAIPMKHINYRRNKWGTPAGILEILRDSDWVESEKVVPYEN